MPSDTDFDYDFGTPIQTMNGLIGHYCLDATPIGARLWGWDEPQRAEFTERFFLLPLTRQPPLHLGCFQMGKDLRLSVLGDLCGRDRSRFRPRPRFRQ
jgi:hypothetical protein